MLLLLISYKMIVFASAGVLLFIGLVILIGWWSWSAKPVEDTDAPKEAPPSVTYDEIQDCEMPYYGSIYH